VQTSTINSWLMMKLHLVQRNIFLHKYDVIDFQFASLISSSSKSILVCLLLINWKELSCSMLHTSSFWNVVMTSWRFFHWMLWQHSILSFFKLVIYFFWILKWIITSRVTHLSSLKTSFTESLSLKSVAILLSLWISVCLTALRFDNDDVLKLLMWWRLFCNIT